MRSQTIVQETAGFARLYEMSTKKKLNVNDPFGKNLSKSNSK